MLYDKHAFVTEVTLIFVAFIARNVEIILSPKAKMMGVEGISSSSKSLHLYNTAQVLNYLRI